MLSMYIHASSCSLNGAKSSSLPEKESFSNLYWVAVISAADCFAPRQLVDLGWLGCDRRGRVSPRRCMPGMVWVTNESANDFYMCTLRFINHSRCQENYNPVHCLAGTCQVCYSFRPPSLHRFIGCRSAGRFSAIWRPSAQKLIWKHQLGTITQI